MEPGGAGGGGAGTGGTAGGGAGPPGSGGGVGAWGSWLSSGAPSPPVGGTSVMEASSSHIVAREAPYDAVPMGVRPTVGDGAWSTGNPGPDRAPVSWLTQSCSPSLVVHTISWFTQLS